MRHNIRLLLILFILRGPSRVSTMGGAHYYVIFVDDFSRFTWIYLLHSRSDFLQVYRDFYTMIRTQFSKKIQISRSNSGGEYKSRPFKSKSCLFLKAHFLSCPVLTHLSKMMVSLRGNTGILWRQLVPSIPRSR